MYTGTRDITGSVTAPLDSDGSTQVSDTAGRPRTAAPDNAQPAGGALTTSVRAAVLAQSELATENSDVTAQLNRLDIAGPEEHHGAESGHGMPSAQHDTGSRRNRRSYLVDGAGSDSESFGVAETRRSLGIKIHGSLASKPIKYWRQAECLGNTVLNYLSPPDEADALTDPVQAQAVPALLSGLDCYGVVSVAGRGRRLAYIIPMLHHVREQPPGQDLPLALCLVPCEEEAYYVTQVIQQYVDVFSQGRTRPIKAVCLETHWDELRGQLQGGAEIIISTPGRLLHLTLDNVIKTAPVSFMVIDGADKIIATGHELCVSLFCVSARKDRQFAVFSSTQTADPVRSLTGRALPNTIQFSVAPEPVCEADLVASEISEVVEYVDDSERFQRLAARLDASPLLCSQRIAIFADEEECAELYQRLGTRAEGWNVDIYGAFGPHDRMLQIEGFQNCTGRALLVACDTSNMAVRIASYVWNYNLPRTEADYIERAGRATCRVYTLVSNADKERVMELTRVWGDKVDVPKVRASR